MHESTPGGNYSRMKPAILEMIVRLSRNLAGTGASHKPDDSDLLVRYVRHRDECAFAAILDRHGRLVWGVCRGLLPNDADADAAFQATFVALFRGAAKIRQVGSLAPWLYGTAARIAKKARQAAARRGRREHRAAKPESAPAVVPGEDWEALHLAVHDEVARLPVILRVAFVLCVLEGRRYEDAAVQLGVPVGTLSARVSRARKMLLDRLSTRGLAPAVAVAAVAYGTANVSAAVPGPLLLLVRHHLADGFASVPKTIVNFATSVAGGASMKVKLLTAAVLIAGTLTATAGGVWFGNAQDKGRLPPGSGPATPRVVPPNPGVVSKKERKVFTPAQVEKDRPEGEVTVTFQVEEVGLLNGSIKKGDPPFMPISLGTRTGLEDRRSKLDAVLVGKALTHVHDLAISDPTAHFRGRTIEVKGKVRYSRFPRVTQPDGTVQVQADNYPHYDIVVDSLDNFRVVADAQEKGAPRSGSRPATPKVVPPGPGADPKKAVEPMKVFTPDQIVQGKVEGPVRVEFTVESLFRYTGVSTEKEVPMNFKLEGVKAGNDEFNVQVAGKLFARLHYLGIEETPEEAGKHGTVAVHRHFMGKKVRVNGVVKRLPHAKGEGVLHWLRIDSLDQIESVSRK